MGACEVAATVAAQHGLKTLLLNREAMPRDKACGDAVPEPAFLLLRKLGMTNSFNDYSCEIDFVKLVGPGGQQVKLKVFPQFGEKTRIVIRHTFDNLLCQHAMQSGAEFRILNVTDPLLDGNRVIGISGKEGQTRVNFYSKVIGSRPSIHILKIGEPRSSFCSPIQSTSMCLSKWACFDS